MAASAVRLWGRAAGASPRSLPGESEDTVSTFRRRNHPTRSLSCSTGSPFLPSLLSCLTLGLGCSSDDPTTAPDPEPPPTTGCRDYGALFAESTRFSDDGYIGGLAVQGDVFLAASSRGLLALAPSPSGELLVEDTLDLYALGVRRLGEVAYVATDTGISAVRVGDPENLEVVTSLVFATSLAFLEVGEGFAVAADADRLYVLDLAEPLVPRQVGLLDLSGAHISDLALLGDHLYVAAGDGLRVVSLVEPGEPREVGHYEAGQLYSVAASGSLVAFYGPTDLLGIVDVTDPTRPVLASAWDLAAVSDGAVALGAGRAYLETPGGLFVFAHENGQGLTELGYAPHPTGVPRDVVVEGERVYLASGDLTTVEVPAASAPPDPVAIAEGEYTHAQLVGDLLYAASSGEVAGFDLTEGTPTLRFEEPLPTTATALAFGNGSVWLGTANGLLELAVDDLPVAFGRSVALGARVDALAVRDGLAYVSRGSEFVVVDLRVDTPVVLGTVAALWPGDEMAVTGTTAFLFRRAWGYQAFDVSAPEAPVVLESRSFVPDPGALALADAGYVAAGLVGELRLATLDGALSTSRLTSDIRDLAFHGDVLYASTTQRIEILEVADPAAPLRVAAWPLRGSRSAPTRVLASSDRLVLWTPAGFELLPGHCAGR